MVPSRFITVLAAAVAVGCSTDAVSPSPRSAPSPLVAGLDPSGLEAEYPMDGDLTDVSGNGLHGTMFGPLVGTADRFGSPNSALAFDGLTARGVLPAASTNSKASGTINLWIRVAPTSTPERCAHGDFAVTDTFPCQYNIFGKVVDGSIPFRSQYGGPSSGPLATFYFTVNGEPSDFVPFDSYGFGQWHMYTYTWGPAEKRIYLDGELLLSVPNSFVSPPSGDLELGQFPSVANGEREHFEGAMDDLVIFSRQLSDAEVETLFDVPPPTTTTSVWLGLKNSDDVGTKFDLRVEILRNSTILATSQLNAVPGGSSGFNNAVLRAIDTTMAGSSTYATGDTLGVRVSVRIAVGVSGHRTGTARVWFNDAAANSRSEVAVNDTPTTFYLTNGFVLSQAPGTGPKKTADVFVDRLAGGNPFKPFGTWRFVF